MESKSEFNLRNRLSTWKKEVCNSKSMDEANFAELESHLLDNMDHLKSIGLTEEEAYLLARRRLGDTNFLAAEFGKVNSGKVFTGRIIDFITGIMFYLMITSVGRLISNTIFYSSPFLGIGPEKLEVINATLLGLTVILIVSLIYYIFTREITSSIKILPISVIILVCLGVIQYMMLPLNTRIFGDSNYSFELLGSLQLQATFFNLGIMLIVFGVAAVAYMNKRRSEKLQKAL